VSDLSIKDGAEVESGGRRFTIRQRIGFDFVVARDIETDDLVTGAPPRTPGTLSGPGILRTRREIRIR
jgi:hypothetical protein